MRHRSKRADVAGGMTLQFQVSKEGIQFDPENVQQYLCMENGGAVERKLIRPNAPSSSCSKRVPTEGEQVADGVEVDEENTQTAAMLIAEERTLQFATQIVTAITPRLWRLIRRGCQ